MEEIAIGQPDFDGSQDGSGSQPGFDSVEEIGEREATGTGWPHYPLVYDVFPVGVDVYGEAGCEFEAFGAILVDIGD